MWKRLTAHLYVRIWLAVVATVPVLIFLVVSAWQITRDPPQLPIREVVVRNAAGQELARAFTRADRKLGDELAFDVQLSDGQSLQLLLPRPLRPPRHPGRLPFGFGFGWLLALVGLAVAVGTYPVMRRLTLRLEALQRGVERWGAGDLSVRVNAQGHDDVALLAQRFNHAAERVETLMASHKTLLANASHELRSPLARIRMGLELMQQQSAAQSARLAEAVPGMPRDAQRYSPHDEMSRSINELDQLIDEILLASRLDANQRDAEPFEAIDLTGLAAEECARLGAELWATPEGAEPEESGTPDNSDGPDDGAPQTPSLMVHGSPRLLRRLIRNLLENARRYSQGAVVLELRPHTVGAQQQVLIRVHDRGPGVPAAERERIFEPFYRLPGASERDGGVGLGLALVKSISQRHGGQVRCEARAGGGATFVVVLPSDGMGHPASKGSLAH